MSRATWEDRKNALRIYCRQCGSQVEHSCTTASGKKTAPHAGRVAEASKLAPKEPTSTRNPARDRSEDAKDAPAEIPSEIDLLVDDARRVARNRTYGIVDGTLDAVEILSELSRRIDEVFEGWHSPEQWDERGAEHDAAIAGKEKQIAEHKAEALTWNERALAAEGKIEQAEVDRDAAIAERDRANARTNEVIRNIAKPR